MPHGEEDKPHTGPYPPYKPYDGPWRPYTGKIPRPLCPHTVEMFEECMAKNKAQVKCVEIIKQHNDCMKRMTYLP